jgi:uncharacterized protein (DUF433 family)
MPSARDDKITVGQDMSIAETAVATGVSVRKINRLIDDGFMPVSAFTKVGKTRFVKAYAAPMVRFVAHDGTMLSKTARVAAMKAITSYTKSHWPSLVKEPDTALHLRFESGTVTVDLGETVSRAMTGLRNLAAANRRISVDPDIRNGMPVVRGTRIGVFEVTDAIAQDGIDAALEDFPALTRDDVEAATIYAQAHPRIGRPRAARAGRLVTQNLVDLAGTR